MCYNNILIILTVATGNSADLFRVERVKEAVQKLQQTTH